METDRAEILGPKIAGFFFSSRRRHTRSLCDWSSDVCSSDLRLPQLASQYLHREKIELAAMLAKLAEQRFGLKGRIHFNVGGSQAVEDSLKLVRNAKNGKSQIGRASCRERVEGTVWEGSLKKR